MPRPGFFVLHSRAVPPLTAGDYTLEGTQHVPGAGNDTETYRGHVRLTSPRFRMPPDQILSTYPPANAEGAFETRLPQIVLKRRTLPWERAVKEDDREIPWLALVVIAEGEGTLSGETPIAECVTPGVVLDGPNDVATGVYLSVPETVVEKVFPTVEDLPLLAHVREVDIEDTELAMGDDDGFLAVILANRLPQFDRQACKPVRYLGCLVNLEGQLDALPEPVNALDVFFADALVFDAAQVMQQVNIDTDLGVMGTGHTVELASTSIQPAAVAENVPTTAASNVNLRSSGTSQVQTNAWATTPANIEKLAMSAAPTEAARLVRDAMGAGFRFPFEPFIPEKVYRFPVLAHWSFTTTGAGSFESLMRDLDVG